MLVQTWEKGQALMVDTEKEEPFNVTYKVKLVKFVQHLT